MRRDPLERLTIRAALFLGFGLVLALWIFTGYTFSQRLSESEARTSDVTRRYMEAQDLLSAVRQQVSSNSIILRNALLDPAPAAQAGYAQRLTESFDGIDASLDAFRPVLETPAEPAPIERLRAEINEFRRLTLQVLAAHQRSGSDEPWDLLNQSITPRRATVIALSEEIRELNRRALVQHQIATALIHRTMERQWWWRLGLGLAASIAIALLAIFYAGRLEDRLRKQRDRDAGHRRDLQHLSTRLVAAQEDERRSISRELHDEVGQVLSAIKVELLMAARSIEAQGGTSRVLDDLQTMTDGALATVRDIAQLLRPALLDDLGLGAAIDWLLRGVERRNRLSVALTQRGTVERLSPEIEIAAFRIAQEALCNVERHSGATRCVVTLDYRPDALAMSITDNGRGFDPAAGQPTDTRRGLGLVGIRERVAACSGSIAIDSTPDRGTTLRIDLPVAARRAPVEVDEPAEAVLHDLLGSSGVHG